jgi:ribosomal protein S18 acetylase RimI-like enzyme
MDAHDAWKVFLTGILETTSARGTVVQRRIGSVLAVRFTKQRAGEVSFFDEYLVDQHEPAQVLAALADDPHLAKHYVTVLSTGQGTWTSESLPGYCVHVTERLMARSLVDLPATDTSLVQIVGSESEAIWLNKHDPADSAWIAFANLRDPTVTHAFISIDGLPVARGASVRCGDALYMTAVYTGEAYRRRGLGRMLMLKLLADGAASGATWSVLTSSVAGEALYDRLGYATLGTLLIFEPDEDLAKPSESGKPE